MISEGVVRAVLGGAGLAQLRKAAKELELATAQAKAARDAVDKVRASGIIDCEAAAYQLGRSGYLPGGKNLNVAHRFGGNHVAYIKDGLIQDPTGLKYVLDKCYWTEAKLAEAGLLDAAKSGVFTPAQYQRFVNPFGTVTIR